MKAQIMKNQKPSILQKKAQTPKLGNHIIKFTVSQSLLQLGHVMKHAPGVTLNSVDNEKTSESSHTI